MHHFNFFQNYDIPRFNMTFPIDVTIFMQTIKQSGLKFYYAFMHLVISEMNRIENFRYRIEGDAVIDDGIQFVSFTDLIPGTDLFKMVSTRFEEHALTFQTNALLASQQQGSAFFNPRSELNLNTVYVTSFPWAQFTHFTHATKLGPKDSVPRVSWSKFVEQNNQKILNLSVEVHHGLVDGYHVGMLINRIQEKLNTN